MSKKNKPVSNFTVDPFIKWAHKSGRIFIFCFTAYTFLVPLTMFIIYGVWPKFTDILPGLIAIFTMMIPVTIAEVGTYTPLLGSSSYLTFITGNLMNLKIPCALNAQKVAGVDANTTEGDAISLISTCVSSIVTTLVLAIGLLLIVPLKGFLQNPAVSAASGYLLPALFGCLMLGFLGSTGKTKIKNKMLVAVLPAILAAVLTIIGFLNAGTAGIALVIVIPMCIGIAYLLWKKGVVKVVNADGSDIIVKEDAPEVTPAE